VGCAPAGEGALQSGCSPAIAAREWEGKFERWHDVGYWQRMLSEGERAPGGIRRVSDVDAG